MQKKKKNKDIIQLGREELVEACQNMGETPHKVLVLLLR